MKKNYKRLLSQIAVTLVFAAGFLIMFYPFYINALNEFIADHMVSNYQKKEASTFKEERKKLQEVNQQFTKEGIVPGNDPFSEENNEAVKSELEEHLIGKVNIPKLAIEIPLFDKTTGGLLEHGATVLDGTSYPVGGLGTHSVITAHRGLPKRELFTDLPKLVKGDIFLMEVLGDVLAYEVDEIIVVEPAETSSLNIVQKQDLVTLVTCTPYMVNSHRLLVTGHRVPYTEEIKKEKQQRDIWRQVLRIGIIVLTFLIILIIVYRLYRKIKQFKNERD